MKTLWHKIKKSNKVGLTFYLLTLIFFIVSYIMFVKELLSLVGIETTLRIIFIFALFCWFLIHCLFGMINLILKKYIKLSIICVVSCLLGIGLIFSSRMIHKIYSTINAFSQDEYITYTTNLVALKETELNNQSKLGIISNEDDIEGNVLAHTLIKKHNLKQEIVYYSDYYEMIDALYKKEVSAIFLTNNYVSVFGRDDTYPTIGTDTKVLYEYSEKMKNKTITNTNKKLTEPFTVLLMGVDSEIDGLNPNSAFNGDTLMLLTFNPKTLTATIFSIPRDTYVPIACNHNRYNKINSAAAYGTSCVINTVQNLTGITIDYFAKINFFGVIDLVNILGGIDVFVEAPDYDYYISQYGEGVLCESNAYRDMANLVCMETGMQHLNGEQALAYARNRHGYRTSDIARNKHQQQIFEALAKKLLTLSSFSDMENMINTVSKNIATNLQTKQILSLYDTLKNMLMSSLKGNDFIKIQKTYLEYYNLSVLIPGTSYTTSAIGHYPGSLEAITQAMRINLDLEDEKMIKTFSYDYQEVYESSIVGKNIRTGAILTTVPNFIGSSLDVAKTWAENNGINLTIEYACGDGIPGLIGNQSVMAGILTQSIGEMTVYINEACPIDSEEPKEPNEEENNNPSIPGMPEENSDEDEQENDNSDEKENNKPSEDNKDDNNSGEDNPSNKDDNEENSGNGDDEESQNIPGTDIPLPTNDKEE